MKSPRLPFVHGPTPIVHHPALDALVGAEVWVKRDDVTGGAESGNKLRKLEFLLADARALGTRAVITCGALQSNHARATALTAARLGMRTILFLRTDHPEAELPWTGNVLLDRLVGAEIRRVTPAQYRERAALMESAAQEVWRGGEQPYVIPEGGSNGLGALGYVDAMRETARQLALGLCGEIRRFDLVAHACGSGGTAAGIALGCALHDVAPAVRAFAVCDDAAYFEREIARIVAEARRYEPGLEAMATLVVDDRSKGPRYGQMSAEQLAFLRDVVRATGLVLDPVYTGKALFGLARAVERGDVARGSRVLFVHTGGLPGLLAVADDPATVASLAALA